MMLSGCQTSKVTKVKNHNAAEILKITKKSQKCSLKEDYSEDKRYLNNELKLLNHNKKFSYVLKDEELGGFVERLSKESGFEFLIGPNVEVALNINIKNKNILEVVELITSTAPIDFKFKNGRFYIESTSDMRNILYNHLYKTKYISPTNIKSVIPELYKDDVFVNDSNSTITISTNRSNLISILNIIEKIDVKTPLVFLELNVLEVASKRFYKYGMGLDKTAGGALLGFSPIINPFGTSVLNNSSAKSFLSRIDMMERNGDASIKASLNIPVQDGEKASFKSELIKMLNGGGVSNVSQIPNVVTMQNIKNLISTGMDLTIIPQVKTNDEILLNILNASSGDFEGLDQSLIRNHSITTKLPVKNGETIVLGGMKSKKSIKEQESNVLFSWIPFLKKLFGDESTKEDDVDLLFTITPRIVCE